MGRTPIMKVPIMKNFEFERCLCQHMAGLNPALCDDEFTFSEKGKKVRLTPRESEWVAAIALDGCVFMDNQPKCDGLFLFCGRSRPVALLVELKGTDIKRAFAQIAYMRQQRPEYEMIKNCFTEHCRGRLDEKAVVVSSTTLSEPKKEALEEAYGIRVLRVLHCEPTSKIPDVREYL
jgi:hypothetical protein